MSVPSSFLPLCAQSSVGPCVAPPVLLGLLCLALALAHHPAESVDFYAPTGLHHGARCVIVAASALAAIEPVQLRALLDNLHVLPVHVPKDPGSPLAYTTFEFLLCDKKHRKTNTRTHTHKKKRKRRMSSPDDCCILCGTILGYGVPRGVFSSCSLFTSPWSPAAHGTSCLPCARVLACGDAACPSCSSSSKLSKGPETVHLFTGILDPEFPDGLSRVQGDSGSEYVVDKESWRKETKEKLCTGCHSRLESMKKWKEREKGKGKEVPLECFVCERGFHAACVLPSRRPKSSHLKAWLCAWCSRTNGRFLDLSGKKPRPHTALSPCLSPDDELVAVGALGVLLDTAQWVLAKGWVELEGAHRVRLSPGTPPFHQHIRALQGVAAERKLWSPAFAALLAYMAGLEGGVKGLSSLGKRNLQQLLTAAKTAQRLVTEDVYGRTEEQPDNRESVVLTRGIEVLRSMPRLSGVPYVTCAILETGGKEGEKEKDAGREEEVKVQRKRKNTRTTGEALKKRRSIFDSSDEES